MNWRVLLIFVLHVALGLHFWFERVPVFVIGWVAYWVALFGWSKLGRDAGPELWSRLAVTCAAGFAGAGLSFVVYLLLGLNMKGS